MWHVNVQLMPGRVMSSIGGHSSWVISLNVRSIRLLLNCVFWVQINRLQRQMMSRDVAVSNSEYSISTSFQLHPWSIALFILALKDGTSSHNFGLLKTCWDTVTLGVDSRQPRSRHLALPSVWTQSLRETLLTDNFEWTYPYLLITRLMLLLL